MISVCLVDDQTLVRQGIRSLLELSDSIRVVAEASDGAQAVEMIPRVKPDVVLLDMRMPNLSGLDVLNALRAKDVLPPTIILTTFDDDQMVLAGMKAGARGYLLKDGTEDELARHVLSLHSGGSPMTPLIARQLLARLTSPARPPAPASQPISAREKDILQALSRGYTYDEAARLLGIAPSTVQSHVKNIYSKLAVHSKTEAIFEARQLGLL